MNNQKMLTVLIEVSERNFNQNETMQWLKRHPLWLNTWGFRNVTKFKDTVLFFTVSGFKHNGYVLISLGWDDTYTVTLLSTQCNVKKVIKNVYCDVLAETIDINVERIDAYQE